MMTYILIFVLGAVVGLFVGSLLSMARCQDCQEEMMRWIARH